MTKTHPRLQFWLDVSGALAEAAAAGALHAQKALTRRHRPAGRVRRPGADTPMWNALADELRGALQIHGAKVRLARYLGIPKQRLTDYLRGGRRLPDAELALRMLHWLSEQRANRDPSL